MSSTSAPTTSGKDASSPGRLVTARDLYRRCVELDPEYAPAWARLGRVHRVLAKYGYGDVERGAASRAEEAFRTALELNPDLPLAHNLYTYFEIEEFGAAPEAMLRLLRLAKTRAADPDLYAGLVVACRFCGLLEASLAADRRARRIDPGVRTSVHYTHWMLGDYEQTVVSDLEEIQTLRYAALWMMGRQEEALAGYPQDWSRNGRPASAGISNRCARPWRTTVTSASKVPGRFWRPASTIPRGCCSAPVTSRGCRTVTSLCSCSTGPWTVGSTVPSRWCRTPGSTRCEPSPEFIRILHRSEEKSGEAAAAFAHAGGERLLGIAG